MERIAAYKRALDTIDASMSEKRSMIDYLERAVKKEDSAKSEKNIETNKKASSVKKWLPPLVSAAAFVLVVISLLFVKLYLSRDPVLPGDDSSSTSSVSESELKIDELLYTAEGVYYIDKSEFEKGTILLTGFLESEGDTLTLLTGKKGEPYLEVEAEFDITGTRWAVALDISSWENKEEYEVLVRAQNEHTSNILSFSVQSDILFGNFRAFSSKESGGLTDLALNDDLYIDMETEQGEIVGAHWLFYEGENPEVKFVSSPIIFPENYKNEFYSDYFNLSGALAMGYHVGDPIDIKSGEEYRVVIVKETIKKEFTFSTKKVEGKAPKRPPYYVRTNSFDLLEYGYFSISGSVRSEDYNDSKTEIEIIVTDIHSGKEYHYYTKCETDYANEDPSFNNETFGAEISNLPPGEYIYQSRLIDGEEKGMLDRPSHPITVSSIDDLGLPYFAGEYAYDCSDPNRDNLVITDFEESNPRDYILMKNQSNFNNLLYIYIYNENPPPADITIGFNQTLFQYILTQSFLDQLPAGENKFIIPQQVIDNEPEYKYTVFTINVIGKP